MVYGQDQCTLIGTLTISPSTGALQVSVHLFMPPLAAGYLLWLLRPTMTSFLATVVMTLPHRAKASSTESSMKGAWTLAC